MKKKDKIYNLTCIVINYWVILEIDIEEKISNWLQFEEKVVIGQNIYQLMIIQK